MVVGIVGLLAIGCATPLTAKSIVGGYELRGDRDTHSFVFLDNGVFEHYKNGGKQEQDNGKWKTVGRELHAVHDRFTPRMVDRILVFRINRDGSLTVVARILGKKRNNFPKRTAPQRTYKKINQPIRSLTLEEKKFAGTYERKIRSNTYRWVFLDNGIAEHYRNGNKYSSDREWSIVDNELHVKYPNSEVGVFKINPDNSITHVANISNGKRIDYTKERETTWKKIN